MLNHPTNRRNRKAAALAFGALASAAFGTAVHAQTSDPLLNILIKRGVINEAEARAVQDENRTNSLASPASRWKLSPGIKSIELFGDVRFRYEYRGAEAPTGDTLARERYRYAIRLGIRGDLLDNFYYGLRLETSTNPRSTWVTFGDASGGVPAQGPSSKNSAGIGIGQAYVGWRPADWAELAVGKMPNPLYTTAMVWDPDINPEGAFERVKYTAGPVDLSATFGQFLQSDTDPDNPLPAAGFGGGNTSDPFILAWQLGATVHINKTTAAKVAPTLYNYTSHGQKAGFPGPFVGQGTPAGSNGFVKGTGFGFNQTGINDLLVFELPAEVNFKVGQLNARVFGDFGINLDGDRRAAAAAAAGGFAKQTGENLAYQIGLGVGNLGLVTGSTARKNTWEARAYWQHVEQYSLDPNLIDSDFFEGRENLQGVFCAASYSFTDNIIGTARYGYARRINNNLGTGGSNADLPEINPITKYQLFQLDLTYRF